nr:uncharacterized protein CFP56_44005 [Quercus suber]
MEDDADSDDEVTGLREGLAAIKLTKETKISIRGPWSKALIVKLYGRKIGFNFIQNKLMQLWKPNGRLDCVDLGNDFFLTRFLAKEDMEAVLRRGPWFIGEHFLSIRPWEPFFNPEVANVSSIAVWVRLYKLPIELYEAEVLKQIGEAIGKVLRIDTHTALESRGKYARMCIQVDVGKPLINTVLIGKFEQAVAYEGINKLCFSCGRISHKKEFCPYIVRRVESSPEKEVPSPKEDGTSSRSLHETAWNGEGSGTAGCSGALPDDDLYGPWMVVARRRTGQRGTRKEVPTTEPTKSAMKGEQRNFVPRNNSRQANMDWRNAGEIEKKRYNEAAQSSPSVKGKKVIARSRSVNKRNTEGAGSSKTPFNFTSLVPKILSRDDPSTPFLFSTTISAEMDNHHQRIRCGNDSRGESYIEREAVAGDGVVRSTTEGAQEADRHGEERKSVGGLSISLGPDMEIEGTKASNQIQHDEGEVSDYSGSEPGEESMELEEKGEATAYP